MKFNANTTAFKKHDKILTVVEPKIIGRRNINTGTTLQLKTLIK